MASFAECQQKIFHENIQIKSILKLQEQLLQPFLLVLDSLSILKYFALLYFILRGKVRRVTKTFYERNGQDLNH